MTSSDQHLPGRSSAGRAPGDADCRPATAAPGAAGTAAVANGARAPHGLDEYASTPEVSVEVADAVSRRLFRIGLTLASCTSVADSTTAGRLRDCIDDLDTVIHDLRQAAFGRYPEEGAGEVDLTSVTTELRSSLGHLTMLVGAAPADDPPSLDLVEAAHCAQRALLALDRLGPPERNHGHVSVRG